MANNANEHAAEYDKMVDIIKSLLKAGHNFYDRETRDKFITMLDEEGIDMGGDKEGFLVDDYPLWDQLNNALNGEFDNYEINGMN